MFIFIRSFSFYVFIDFILPSLNKRFLDRTDKIEVKLVIKTPLMIGI